jgi:glycosyltransferase involved in cell wall biosynthesis
MSHPKILHIVAGAGRGGAETFSLDAILALHDNGLKQHVICRPHPHVVAALNARNIPFTPFGFGWSDRLLGGRRRIARVIESFKPDLVHAWMGRAASFVPAQTDIPVLGWFGGYYDLKRYKNCHFYMGVTWDIVRHLTEKSGAPDKCFLGHTFGTLAPCPPVDRAALNTPQGAPVVLLLSRMHPKKGIDTLLHAAKQLPGVYFWLAGDGPNRPEYQALCTELNLDDRVRFLGWRDDRPALLEQATVCALPSRYEPFGTVMAEAWFAGVPLVAARAAGPSQYVAHGQNGLLVDIDDVDGLATALNAAITDQTLRQTLIAGGQATYAESFSREGVIAHLIQNYTHMIDAHRA